MKLEFVHLCGFRGYQKPVRIDFAEGFTIIDGRNGVGKSTIFDAVEFSLTGTISKYLDAKADRESVEDYLWWTRGAHNRDSDTLAERFVEVGFCEGEDHFAIKRTPLDRKTLDVSALTERLYHRWFAPTHAIAQLCRSTIIRDEHIARLSLDLKESDRFTLLRDAIGAVDADEWIKRAYALVVSTSKRVEAMTKEIESHKQALAIAERQIDQARAAVPATSLLSQAAARLQATLKARAPADQLPDVARRRLADNANELEKVRDLASEFEDIAARRSRCAEQDNRVKQAGDAVAAAQVALDDRIAAIRDTQPSTNIAERARQLEALVNLGRKLGLRDGHCPLCESSVSDEQLNHGLEAALAAARQLDARAVNQAERERERDEAQSTLTTAQEVLSRATAERDRSRQILDNYDRRLEAVGLTGATIQGIHGRVATLESERQSIAADLRVIDTYSLDHALVRAGQDLESAKDRVRRAEGRLGRARLAETRGRLIHDAARRAAAETLDQRLDRVLPLMSELYNRLRPHPTWTDIEYSVRGDVQRFLKLQVGGDVNPQFVFSSGQRRTTGLAFLLSVNLSIAWSRWQSILLDDPVQHIDDFRAVHLAEVLAHLCQSGRQIVCAVEDSALADLMCRRLPSSESAPGKRITLGTDRHGALTITRDQKIAPLSRRALILPDQPLSA